MPTGRWGKMPAGVKIARIDIDPGRDVAAEGRYRHRCGHRRRRPGPGRTGRPSQRSRAGCDHRPRQGGCAGGDPGVQPQMSFLEAIREVLPENGIICDEMTQVGYVSWFGFPFHTPRSLITSGFSGTLGAGFPTALGVKVAMPGSAGRFVERRWRIPVRRRRTGDRDAVRDQPDHHRFQQLRLRQCAARPAPAVRGTRLRLPPAQPRFPGYARSFGVHGWRVTNAAGLRDAWSRHSGQTRRR